MASGNVLIIQGGVGKDEMTFAPSQYIQLNMLSSTDWPMGFQYSYPWTNWSAQSTWNIVDHNEGSSDPAPTFTGDPASATKQAVSQSYLMSFPPLIFSTKEGFFNELQEEVDLATYMKTNNIAHADVAKYGLLDLVANNTAWGTLFFRAGHAAFRVQESIFFHGGFSTAPDAMSPTPMTSAVNTDLFQMQFDEKSICSTSVEVADKLNFPSGRQRPRPTSADACVLCSPGTYYDPAVSPQACYFCPAGRYSGYPGAYGNCSACPAGFFSQKMGGLSVASCDACPAGQYNTVPGAEACLPCPNGTVCPVASITPIPILPPGSPPLYWTSFEFQPPALVPADKVIAELNSYIGMAAAGGLVVLILDRKSVV